MKRRQEDVFEDFAREFIRRHQRPVRRPVRRILAAIDFSLSSLAALEYAEELARRFGAQLLLLHAEGDPTLPAEVRTVSRRAARTHLARTVKHLREQGLSVRGLRRSSAPAEAIVKAAADERASFIVMGTHGRSGVARVLLGSVAELVVRRAPCPVLTVGLPRRA